MTRLIKKVGVLPRMNLERIPGAQDTILKFLNTILKALEATHFQSVRLYFCQVTYRLMTRSYLLFLRLSRDVFRSERAVPSNQLWGLEDFSVEISHERSP